MTTRERLSSSTLKDRFKEAELLICALITRQRTRTSRPRRIQPRRRSGPVDRVFPERVELAGKSPSRDSSGQAAGFECTMSCSANLEIMITIIHWGAF